MLPLLTACREDAMTCDCMKLHVSASSAVQEPVLDLWRRQWLSSGFKQCNSDLAAIFMVNLRVVESLLVGLLGLSGQHGIYVEPRTLDAAKPHEAFQTIWVPRVDSLDLQRHQQLDPQIIGLCRLGSRLGVRVESKHAKAIAEKLRPETVFLASGSRMMFELGPIPFGMDRLGVTRLCSNWGWEAKPLNPCRPAGQLGMIWKVQSCVEPPRQVVLYRGGEILITKLGSDGQNTAAVPQTPVLANPNTLAKCVIQSQDAGEAVDPWLKHDPWGGKPIAPAAPSTAEIEDRLHRRVLDSIDQKTEKMEIDSTANEARIQALEKQVQSIQSAQTVLESKVDESTKRLDHQVSSLQDQVGAQFSAQGQRIQELFNKQMHEMEALLTKRSRSRSRREWRWGQALTYAWGGGLCILLITMACVFSLGPLKVHCASCLWTFMWNFGLSCLLMALLGVAWVIHGLLGLDFLCPFGVRQPCVRTSSFVPPGRFGSIAFRLRPTHCFWIWTLLCCRVGEASLPGPSAEVPWKLGVCNPSGLTGKALQFRDSDVDVWLVSESHLTVAGINSFKSSLRSFGSHYKWLVHGHPVLPRSEVSDVGVFSGVCTLSAHPARRLCHQWDPVTFASGRLCASTVLCQDVWVSTVYCPPTGQTHRGAVHTADALLWLAAERVNQLSGPRFVAGDWNHSVSRLDSVAALQRLGFVDVQDLRMQLTGRLPEPTCRAVTRRDFLMVSPELARLFVSCEVTTDMWPDHACVVASFRPPKQAIVRFPWPVPQPIPGPKNLHREGQCTVDFNSGDCTVWYREFWAGVESDVASALSAADAPNLPWKGRGKTLAPVTQVSQIAPLKPARAGDQQPRFLGSSFQHVQWHRQMRRLVSYIRVLGAEPTANQAKHKAQLWTSILRAKGFRPSFRRWWTLQDHGMGILESVPLDPPDLDQALHSFEQALNTARKHAYRLKGATTLSELYRTVRRPPPPQVDSLHTECAAVVTDVCHEDLAVTFDREVEWVDPDAPFAFPIGCKKPYMVSPLKVWLESVEGIEVGDVGLQVTRVGSLPDLFQAFESYWADFWCKHDRVPMSQWDNILAFARQVLKPVDALPCDITPDLFRATVLAKSNRAAVGLDGVSKSDLLQLSPDEVRAFISMFARAHATGDWPQQCLNGSVKSLAKTEDPVHVGSYRPVTIFGLPYRIWGSMMSRYWIKQLDAVLDPFVSGNRPHTSASEVWYYVLRQVELGHVSGRECTGLVLDLTKAFKAIPRLVAIAATKLLGLDEGVLRAWSGALGCMKRHFAVRDSYSPGIGSSRGVPEGCGMSILAMMGVASLFHAWVQASVPSPTVLSFVDNWEVLVSSPVAALRSLEAVLDFSKQMDLKVDMAKTFFWSTSAATRKQLKLAVEGCENFH